MADDPKKPYGDVEYADSGVQEDGKKRYPLDSLDHCRAALSYVSMPKNAAKYTDEQLVTIKAKIRAALKRYGVEVEASAEPPPDPQPEQHEDLQAPAESGASSSPAPGDEREAFVPSRMSPGEAAALIHAAATKTTTAGPAEAATTNKEGAASMDTAKLREALGLAPDVSDDEVKAALVTAGLAPPAPPTATAEPGNPDQRLAANATRAGLITIDPEQLQQYQAGMIRAEALSKRLQVQERDTTINAAIEAGKFPPVRKANYERLWDADPDGTRELIASLAPGLVPVTAMGYSTDAEDAMFDAEFAKLFPPTLKEAGRG
jgi:hypothetical protein